MKKLITAAIILLILSCRDGSISDNNTKDIKYFTRNGVKIGTIIKRDLKDKNVVVLTYPQYVSQSYQLIKYISSIMKNYDLQGVMLSNAPETDSEKPLNDLLIKDYPYFAFNEFVDLYNYLKKNNISLINTLEATRGKFLVLSPEETFIQTKGYVEENFKSTEILYLCMNGIDATKEITNFVPNLPEGKKISTVPLKNSRFNTLSKDFYAVLLMGDTDNYKYITPITLYNKSNYMLAPDSYLEQNKFPIKSVQINRMNNYLNKKIKKSRDKI